jgi:hypothetical protein
MSLLNHKFFTPEIFSTSLFPDDRFTILYFRQETIIRQIRIIILHISLVEYIIRVVAFHARYLGPWISLCQRNAKLFRVLVSRRQLLVPTLS